MEEDNIFMETELLDFHFPTTIPSIIKVIGVGGGGGNAVTHMYREGIIHDVSFVVCNTDNQALLNSVVPIKIQLGKTITGGLGAGGKPEIGKSAAEESVEDLEKLMSDDTKMVFITAGMGGGTGTGAAPIIAGVAKRMGILTVGIVTIPFVFEGEKKIYQALEGVEELKKNVDALLVINNERLREIYFDLDIPNAFKRADNTLTVAVKSISEIITITGYINMDFADVNTILKNGGVALMSYGLGKGENRVSTAIEEAKRSPLLNNDDIFKAKKILLNITYDTVKPLMMEEMQVVHDFMGKFSADREVIWGTAYEPDLEENVKVTILATGFSNEDTDTLKKAENGGIIGKTDEEIQHEKEEVERKKELMIKYYKEDINSPTPKPFVFKSLYNMDDDEIIEALLKYPTYNRKPQLIPNIVCKLEARRTATVYNEKEKNNS